MTSRTEELTRPFILIIVFLAVLGAVAIQVVSGVGILSSLLLTALVCAQTIAGGALWIWLTGRRAVLELIGMGLAIGASLSVLAGVVVVSLGGPALGCMIPAGVILVALVVRIGRDRGRARRVGGSPHWTVARRELYAFCIGLGLVLLWLAQNLRNYPLEWIGSWSRIHPDMPFFAALSTSLARLGPWDSIFLPGGEMRYHWLAYAWSGQLTEITQAETFVVLTRAFPYSMALAALCLVVAWSSALTRRLWTPTLAAVLLLLGGYVGIVNGGILNFDSPSQSMGVVLLLATSITLIVFVNSAGLSRIKLTAWIGLLGFLGYSLTLGKISAAAPALVASALIATVAVLSRRTWAKRACAGFAAMTIGAVTAYLLFMSGANGGGGLSIGSIIDRTSSQQGLNFTEGVVGVMIGTAVLILAIALRWAGFFWLAATRKNWQRPEIVYGFGLAISSLAAIAFLNGFNEIWFAAAASAPLIVLSSEGFESALDRLVRVNGRSARSIVLFSGVFALLTFVLVWALWATGPSGGSYWRDTWRWFGPIAALIAAVVFGWLLAKFAGERPRIQTVGAGLVLILVLLVAVGRLFGVGSGQVGVPPGLRPDLFSFGGSQVVKGNDTLLIGEVPWSLMQAASWLRSNSEASDFLATNLTFGPLVPAVTGLQTLTSGIQYQAPYGRPSSTLVLLERDAQSWGFINAPSSETLAPLCEADVTWVWVHLPSTEVRNWSPFATNQFEIGETAILRLEC
jgi:hypothetical protein